MGPAPGRETENQEWLGALAGSGARRDEAVGRLHALLLGAARFEVAPPPPPLPHLRGDELDDIAMQAADDALMSVLRRLDDFRGDSRFTTWAYKFALLEAAVKLRRRAWQGREVPLEPEAWARPGRGRPTRPGAEQASCWTPCARDPRGPHPAPARGARRARAERRADRRPRRAPRHHARRALQDPARRAPQASRPSGGAAVCPRWLEEADGASGPPQALLACSARAGRRSAARSASRSWTATSISSSPAPTPRRPSRDAGPPGRLPGLPGGPREPPRPSREPVHLVPNGRVQGSDPWTRPPETGCVSQKCDDLGRCGRGSGRFGHAPGSDPGPRSRPRPRLALVA